MTTFGGLGSAAASGRVVSSTVASARTVARNMSGPFLWRVCWHCAGGRRKVKFSGGSQNRPIPTGGIMRNVNGWALIACGLIVGGTRAEDAGTLVLRPARVFDGVNAQPHAGWV